MNLHTDTDSGVGGRGGRAFLLAAALWLAAPPAAAQEPARTPAEDRRTIALRSRSDQPVVYWKPGVPLQLVLDAPPGKGAFRLPGARVQPHPVLGNAVVITPTRALARKRGPVPVTIPLATGAVTVSFVARPEAPDRRVDLSRAYLPPPASQPPFVEAAAGFRQPPWAEVQLAGSWSPVVASTVPACWTNVMVRTSHSPEGHLLEVRSSDPAFCAALVH